MSYKFETNIHTAKIRAEQVQVPIVKVKLFGPTGEPIPVYTSHEHSTQFLRDELANHHADMVAGKPVPAEGPSFTTDDLKKKVEATQLVRFNAGGTFSGITMPRASAGNHHLGDATKNLHWSMICNNVVAKMAQAFPDRIVMGAQMPQTKDPNCDLGPSIKEFERVAKLGARVVLLNPDPSGGKESAPVITDRYWYPFWEKAVEHNIPVMLHVSASCDPTRNTTGERYINADTSATVQLALKGEQLFKDFPQLKMIVTHAGGALPAAYGRFKGIADMEKVPVKEPYKHYGRNVFMDNIVYDELAMEMLFRRVAKGQIPMETFVQAGEYFGACQTIDPETGRYYDDTIGHLSMVPNMDEAFLMAVLHDNPNRVFGIGEQVQKQVSGEQKYEFNYLDLAA